MTRRKTVKGTRKRRLARLPSAILPDATISEILREDTNGLTPKFELTTAQWREVEASCCPLDAADRQEIGKLVSSYFQFQPFERSTPFEADNKKLLAKVHKAAEGFHRALEELEAESERAGLEADERDAAFNAKVLIELRLEKMHCILSRMDDFKNATEGFLTAAGVVGRELKDDAGKGSNEGESWNKLVVGLSQWFAGKGLRVTASKGQGNPSAFVAFMRELQKTFLKEFRRHTASDEALAKAIGDAKKAHRAALEGSALELLNTAEGEAGKVSKLDEAKRFLRAALSKGERPQDEFKTEALAQGISWGTLKRASEGCEIIKRKDGFGAGARSIWGLWSANSMLQNRGL